MSMQRKQQIKSLRRAGRSLDDIAHQLGLSRSTVYWHIKDLPLTLDQQAVLHRRWQVTMAHVNAKRRGIARSGPLPSRPRWSEHLVHLVSHLMFDGRIDRWGGYYYNRSPSQLQHVVRLLKRLYGVTSRIK